jgi:hypothetical protein
MKSSCCGFLPLVAVAVVVVSAYVGGKGVPPECKNERHGRHHEPEVGFTRENGVFMVARVVAIGVFIGGQGRHGLLRRLM